MLCHLGLTPLFRLLHKGYRLAPKEVDVGAIEKALSFLLLILEISRSPLQSDDQCDLRRRATDAFSILGVDLEAIGPRFLDAPSVCPLSSKRRWMEIKGHLPLQQNVGFPA